jgi:hypothetical protein
MLEKYSHAKFFVAPEFDICFVSAKKAASVSED